MAELSATSTRPYLIRAIYEWCNDNGFTPYIAVAVDERTHVPREHVRAGEIVLNLSPAATNRLQLGNDLIEFQARFSGAVRELSIPVENVSAIYARENGHGMAFEVAKAPALAPGESASAPASVKATPAPKLEAATPAAEAPAESEKVARLPAVVPSPTPAGGASEAQGGGAEGETRLATVTPLTPSGTEPPGDGPDSGNGGRGKTRGRAKLTRIK